jgi:hypothetical protein
MAVSRRYSFSVRRVSLILLPLVVAGALCAEIHQRSNLVGGDPATTDFWVGELQIMPSSG